MSVHVATNNTRRRNIYLALSLILFAISCMFIFGLKGMIWLMWRDQPLIAGGLLATSLFFAFRWWRLR